MDLAENVNGVAGEVDTVRMSNGGGVATALACHSPELTDNVAAAALNSA